VSTFAQVFQLRALVTTPSLFSKNVTLCLVIPRTFGHQI